MSRVFTNPDHIGWREAAAILSVTSNSALAERAKAIWAERKINILVQKGTYYKPAVIEAARPAAIPPWQPVWPKTPATGRRVA